jgi:hypothetical protein
MIDSAKAFDAVDDAAVLRKIKILEMHASTKILIIEFLTRRSQITQILNQY